MPRECKMTLELPYGEMTGRTGVVLAPRHIFPRDQDPNPIQSKAFSSEYAVT